MNNNTIVDIQTDHCSVFKTLFEVLKETLNDITLDIVRDPDQKKEEEKPDDKIKKKTKSKEKSGSKDKKKRDKDKEDDQENEEEKSEQDTKIENKGKPSAGGIKIIALDEHQTLLIYVKLDADKFVNFYVKPEVHSIGLDITQFHKFMKTIDKESIMRIYINENDKNYIVFDLQNNVKNNNVVYKQKLLDIDDTSRKLPKDASFQMSVTMDTSDFRKICTEMNQFSEYVEILSTNNEITFKCQGDSNSYIKTFKNSATGVRIKSLKNDKTNGPNIVQGIYSLKHLVSFGKCVNLCDEVELYLKNKYPLFISYGIGLLGKMLVGLTPIDEKAINKDEDYNDENDQYYDEKKVVMKEI